jgi:hypothetical protein
VLATSTSTLSEGSPATRGGWKQRGKAEQLVRSLAVGCAVALLACARTSSDAVYTLVRSSAADQSTRSSGPPLRLHVATFDAAEGEGYNVANCEIARTLFESQPGVTVRYWCERGRFRE